MSYFSDPHFLLKAGVLVISAWIAVLRFRNGSHRASRASLFTLTLAIGVLSFTFVDQMIETQEEVENTRATLIEIQRNMEKIEKVLTFVDISIRSDQPVLEEYKKRLELSESNCLQKAASLLDMEVSPGRRIPREYLIENGCLPDPLREPLAWGTLEFLVLDLRFFRSSRPLSQCTGLGLVHSKPDLVIPLRASLGDENLQLVYDRLERIFILRAQRLDNDSVTFEGNGQIAAVGDLAGARMVIEARNLSAENVDSSKLSDSMRVARIRLRFAGAHTYEIDSSEESLKEIEYDNSVRYLYCFPGALEAK